MGRKVQGLLDTGAAMSCIGGNLAKDYIYSNKPLKRVFSDACTADGSNQTILGRINTMVEYKGEEKKIELYVISSLKQDLYLGIDFWKQFDLLPSSLVVGETAANSEHNSITEFQRAQLNSVMGKLPSFAPKGLGKTSLLSLTIDTGMAKAIKQRHFPVSPAIEKLLYAEVDRMLKLGVIEESDSPWSSPVVVVQKPGKVKVCLDSRKVNAVTEKDAHQLPQIDVILSRLPKANFISSLDLKDVESSVESE
ncbi:hypothetical protein KR074_001824, partial [Drosophila pseudoananassae]